MQFIHLGRRSGTLLLTRGAERAVLGFHRGKLVIAQAPRTPKLGDLLVSSGLLEPESLRHAIDAQAADAEHRSLGQILVSAAALDPLDLRNVILHQIEQAVAEVVSWETGSFDFAVDDLRPIDDIALYPSDVLPEADINTQMVLLEAARIFDERDHVPVDSGEAGEPEGERTNADLAPEEDAREATQPSMPVLVPQPVDPAGDELDLLFGGAPRHRPAPVLPALHVVSPDVELSRGLLEALDHHHRLPPAERMSLGTAGEAAPGAPPPIVLLDLREGGVSFDQAAVFHRDHPAARLLALVEPGTSFAQVYASGVMAALPPEVESVIACVDNLIDAQRAAPPRDGRALDGPRSGMARLRRVFGELRSGLISATVALNLMHLISESFERAVLFLVKRDQLFALGAFGDDSDGRPLAERTRGLRLPAQADNALTRALADGEVQSVSFDQADLPEPFRTMVGRPRSNRVVVFPVLGAQLVISVVYTDNGEREETVEDIDILELATAQVGIAFENELLRRQIAQQKD